MYIKSRLRGIFSKRSISNLCLLSILFIGSPLSLYLGYKLLDNEKKKPFYHFCPYCYYEGYIKDICPRCNGKMPWLKIKSKLKSNYIEIGYNSLPLSGKLKILRSYNLPDWERVRSIGYPSEATKSSIGQKGENVLTGCQSSVFLLNNNGTVYTYRLSGTTKAVALSNSGLTLCADKTSLYLLDQKGKLLWEFGTYNAVFTENIISDVFITPNSNFMAASMQDGDTYILKKTGEVLWRYIMWEPIAKIAIDNNCQYLAAASSEGTIFFFSTKGNLLWFYYIGSSIQSLSIDPYGKHIGVSTGNKFYLFNNLGKILFSIDYDMEIYKSLILNNSGIIIASKGSVDFIDIDVKSRNMFLIDSRIIDMSKSEDGTINILDENGKVSIISYGGINFRQHDFEESSIFNCPNCGLELKNDWIMCPKCLYSIKKNCPNCNKKIKSDWKACPYCASKL